LNAPPISIDGITILKAMTTNITPATNPRKISRISLLTPFLRTAKEWPQWT
jgi:hypothetical protein